MYSSSARQVENTFLAVHRIFTNIISYLQRYEFCSLLFGVVRCVFVLENAWKLRRCAESCTCSFCSLKKRDTPYPLKTALKNVVGEVFKCGQILYTCRSTSHNICRELEREHSELGRSALFSCPQKRIMKEGFQYE